MARPRFRVERADPDLVRRVQAAEAAEERERRWVQEVQRRIDAATWHRCPPERAFGEYRGWISSTEDVPQLERILASVAK